jgi:hypothetical protein
MFNQGDIWYSKLDNVHFLILDEEEITWNEHGEEQSRSYLILELESGITEVVIIWNSEKDYWDLVA